MGVFFRESGLVRGLFGQISAVFAQIYMRNRLSSTVRRPERRVDPFKAQSDSFPSFPARGVPARRRLLGRRLGTTTRPRPGSRRHRWARARRPGRTWRRPCFWRQMSGSSEQLSVNSFTRASSKLAGALSASGGVLCGVCGSKRWPGTVVSCIARDRIFRSREDAGARARPRRVLVGPTSASALTAPW